MKVHTFQIFSPKVVFFLFLLPLPLLAQWQPDVRLTFNDSISRTPCVAVDSSETVITAWSDDRSGGRNHADIFCKRSTDSGMSWSPDTNLTFTSSDSRFPGLAASGSTFHLVWQEKGTPNWEIHYKRSTDEGASWSPDTTLSEVTSDSAGSWNPTVATWGQTVHVAWADGRGGGGAPPDIFYKRSLDGGASWGPDTRLTFASGFSANPSITVSGDTVHLAWADDRTGNDNIFYKRSTNQGGTWSTDTNLTNLLSYGTNPAISASGSLVHLAWVNDGQDVFYKRSWDNGNHWTPGTRLAAGTGAFPSISASGSNVHIAWVDDRDGNFEIYYRRNSELLVRLTNDTASSMTPAVCAWGPMVHVVWADHRDGNDEIYYKRNPTGNVGVETPVGRLDGLTVGWLKITPNPFVAFATVPGQEGDWFEMYNVAGRKVGTYRGERIGFDVPPGVYFLRAAGKTSPPVRVVKVR